MVCTVRFSANFSSTFHTDGIAQIKLTIKELMFSVTTMTFRVNSLINFIRKSFSYEFNELDSGSLFFCEKFAPGGKQFRLCALLTKGIVET